MEYFIIACFAVGLFAFGCLCIYLIDRRMRKEDEQQRK